MTRKVTPHLGSILCSAKVKKVLLGLRWWWRFWLTMMMIVKWWLWWWWWRWPSVWWKVLTQKRKRQYEILRRELDVDKCLFIFSNFPASEVLTQYSELRSVTHKHSALLWFLTSSGKICNPPLIVPTTKDYADGFSNPFLSLRDRTTQYWGQGLEKM